MARAYIFLRTGFYPTQSDMHSVGHHDLPEVTKMKALKKLLQEKASTLLVDSPGWVYAIKNEHLVGMVKIGMSKNPIKHRIKQLSTAFPSNFIIVASAKVRHAKIVERVLHESFANSRVHKNREFFMVPDIDAANAIGLCGDVMGYFGENPLIALAKSHMPITTTPPAEPT